MMMESEPLTGDSYAKLRESGNAPAFYGWREKGKVTVYLCNRQRLTALNCRNDLRNHSPDGPEWGYNGSGPAQLALGLACHVLPDKQALAVYQTLKRQCVAKLNKDGWKWTVTGLRETVLAIFHAMKLPEECNCGGCEECFSQTEEPLE